MENKYDKLIELLNQYEIDRWMWSVFNIWKFAWEIHYYDNEKDEFVFDNVKLYIISKGYGFIKWLVDNDKIDRLTFCTVETPSSKYEDFDLWPETPREDYTNILLMDLAIQEKPIEFLISILK